MVSGTEVYLGKGCPGKGTARVPGAGQLLHVTVRTSSASKLIKVY